MGVWREDKTFLSAIDPGPIYPLTGRFRVKGDLGMQRLFGRRTAGACLAVLAVGLLVSGCDWYELGGSSAHNGDNAFDTTITPANVSTLSAHFSATDGTTGSLTPTAVVNGVLYASSDAGLEAYSANGTNGCSGSPVTCAPSWSYATGPVSGNAAVLNGVVYASTSSGLEAFDAAGQTNCSATPRVCQSLWSAPGSFGDPTVSNGTVYVTSSAGIEAFDAAGQIDCAGSPKVCVPIWSGGEGYGTVTVSAGVAFVFGGPGAVAFDANGSTGCSGTPKVCSPLWSYHTNYSPADYTYPIVVGTTLFVGTGGIVFHASFDGDLEAFDAGGIGGCSNSLCQPLWADHYAFPGDPLVAGDGAVFQPGPFSPTITFEAFAAGGSGAALWSSSELATPLVIGGSVLYAQGENGDIQAYDAGGSAGCSGSPMTCAPLWSTPGTNAIEANGTVYVSTTGASGKGEIVAYGLP